MARFKHMMFVCTKERPADDAKGSCKVRGSEQLLDRLKELQAQHKLKGQIRITSSGCLDFCAKGCTVAVYSSEGRAKETWYTRLKPADADRLFETHVLRGELLEERIEQCERREP